MSGFAPFRVKCSAALLALISAAFAGEAAAVAARVDFSTGGVTVAGRDGRVRPLAKGAQLDSGDTVRTNNGRAQLRFTDGSYVSLQPNSEFGISDYRYEGKNDGSERGFFALVKGAMRTVTGAVGKVNRNAYRISTPTATVGIRGTGGVIQVQPDGSTLVIGTSGIWSLGNAAGTIDVPAGVAALAPAEPKAPPRETTQQPTAAAAPLPAAKKADIATGDQVTTGGLPKGIVLASGGGYATSLAYTIANRPLLTPGINANAAFDELGQLLKVAFGLDAFGLDVGATHAEFGTDGILAWGRWVGPVAGNAFTSGIEKFADTQGFHYVIGTPTPVMPTSGTASYSLLGATSPTYNDGSTAPGKFSGALKVDFGTATVGMDLNIAMPDGRGYGITGSARVGSSQFFASTAKMEIAVTPSGGACTSSACSADVSGFFAGPNAERAGLGYRVQDPLAKSGTAVMGAAAFAKQ